MKIIAATICNGFTIHKDCLVDIAGGFCTHWSLPDAPPQDVRLPFLLVLQPEADEDLQQLQYAFTVHLQDGSVVGEPDPVGSRINLGERQPDGSPLYIPMGLELVCRFEAVGPHFVRVTRMVDSAVMAEVPFGVGVRFPD